jgi:hypothetical protein
MSCHAYAIRDRVMQILSAKAYLHVIGLLAYTELFTLYRHTHPLTVLHGR